MRDFIVRLLCKHGVWRLLRIGWDGIMTVDCRKCGKIRHIPLGGSL